MSKLLAWSRQPTTVAGLSTLCGTLAALLAAQVTWQAALPLLVGALVGIVLPDDAGAKVAIAHLVTDAVQAEQLVMTPRQPVTVLVPGAVAGGP